VIGLILIEEVTACFVEIIETTALFQDVLVVCDNVERVKSFLTPHKTYFLYRLNRMIHGPATMEELLHLKMEMQ
jgi:hypothetical protein